MKSERSSISITLAVWNALFLRESVSRLTAGRAAWLWLLLEPIVHILSLVIILGSVGQRKVSGVDSTLFLMAGILSFFLVRNVATRSMEAINANLALFAYRQVKPVDTVLARAALEILLLTIVMVILFAGAGLGGHDITPHDPLLVIYALNLLALAGLGYGLVFSAAGHLVPEIGRVGRLVFQPLYFLSTVMYPAFIVPQPYRDLLMLNPLVHGMEAMRAGYFETYYLVPEISLGYLAGFGLVSVFLGLVLHVRFQQRLIAQ